MNLKDTQIEVLRRSQGHRYHIDDRYDSRGDIPMHDFPLDSSIDSPDTIYSVRTGGIIAVVGPYHLKTGSIRVVWHAEVRK